MRKQFRVQIDITIDIDEANIQFNPLYTWETRDEAWEQECLDRQHRLFRAILAQPEALNLFFTYLISSEIETVDWKRWHKILLGSPDVDIDDILAPVIETLDAADQNWFADSEKQGVFYESTEEFQAGFSTSTDDITLVEWQESEAES